MTKETEEKIGQLQMMEQNLQNFLMQKQQLQGQLIEIESALSELKDAKDAYKIVGNIMISSTKEDLEKELNQKKEIVELRIKTLEKQESKIKEKASSTQAEVMEQLKKEKK
jgi:prefoldin beta subunit